MLLLQTPGSRPHRRLADPADRLRDPTRDRGRRSARCSDAAGSIAQAGVALPEGLPLHLLYDMRPVSAPPAAANVSAVSGALLTPAAVLREAGGLDPSLRELALIEYCLRATESRTPCRARPRRPPAAHRDRPGGERPARPVGAPRPLGASAAVATRTTTPATSPTGATWRCARVSRRSDARRRPAELRRRPRLARRSTRRQPRAGSTPTARRGSSRAAGRGPPRGSPATGRGHAAVRRRRGPARRARRR